MVLFVFWLSFAVRVEAVIQDPGWIWWPGIPINEQQTALRQDRWTILGVGLLAVTVIFAGGLWTTLVFRQMVAAFWITVLVPGFIVSIVAWLGGALGLSFVTEFVCGVLLLYSGVALAWSWRLFRRVEDTPFGWSNRELPALGELLGSRSGPAQTRPGHPVATLIRQELALHQAGLAGAAVLLVLNLGCIGIRASGLIPEQSGVHAILEPIGFFWLLVPLMLGASAIAEERRLGTLESHLCLPVSRHQQFVIKLGVAVLLGVLIGAGALLVTEWLSRHFGVAGLLGPKGFDPESLLAVPVACFLLTLTGLYASSLSRSTLQALGVAVLLLVGFFFAGIWLTDAVRYGLGWFAHGWIIWTHVGVLLCAGTFLSYHSFSQLHLDRRWFTRNGLTLVLIVALASTLTAGIYFRAWELVMPMEPEHGPARIAADGQPKLATMWAGGYKLFVLLPDGRLWVSGQEAVHRMPYQSSVIVPLPGAFLDTSNWTDLVACGFQAIGRRADGTLWSLRGAERSGKDWRLVEDQARQIGTETNWVSLAAGQMHLLAGKGDGTLWGWGNNKESQVCEQPIEVIESPTRIGQDSDWAGVFASGDTTVGVKRDGSAWRWGSVREFRGDRLGGVRAATQVEPVRWEVDLSEVKKFVGTYSHDLLLYGDGRLEAVGQLLYNLLGTPTHPHYTEQPIPVGGDLRWRDVTEMWNQTMGVSQDGRLWKDAGYGHKQTLTLVSEHDDWLAAQGCVGHAIALAADGTLSFWATEDWGGALTPSRRPLASYNIFDKAP
jgi:hypothetical protein